MDRRFLNMAAAVSAAAVMCCGWLHGQSLNIDFGAEAGVPASDYAAAGLAGVWNSVHQPWEFPPPDAVGPIALVNLAGQPTAATVTATNTLGTFDAQPTGPTGGDAALMNDGLIGHSPDITQSILISGLQNGLYRVITYTWVWPAELFGMVAFVEGSSVFQSVGGPWPGALTVGVTHMVHIVEVKDGTIALDVAGAGPGSFFNGNNLIQGLQLWKIDEPVYLNYDKAPRVFTRDPDLFHDLILGNNSTHMKFALWSDSRMVNPAAAPGNMASEWLRRLLHQRHGHTPMTPLMTHSDYGWAGGALANWLQFGYRTSGVTVGALAPNNTLPNYKPYAFYPWDATGHGWGLTTVLNHRNDNTQSLGVAGGNLGYYAIDAATAQAGVANPAFASGTMQGGESLIDASSGIHAEFLGLTSPGRDPQVKWWCIPWTAEQLAAMNPGIPSAIASGELFGGSDSLDASQGAAYIATTPTFPALSGSEGFYGLVAHGWPTLNTPEKANHFFYRYRSNNPRGRGLDCFAAGGYITTSIAHNHGDSGYILAAMAHDMSIISLGETGSDRYDASKHEDHMRALIAWLRDPARYGPNHPVLLVSYSQLSAETDAERTFPGVLHKICQDTDRTCLVNARLISEEDYGWNSSTEATFMYEFPAGPPFVHFNADGAEVYAKSIFLPLFEYLDQLHCAADIAPADKPDNTVNIVDLHGVISAWGAIDSAADINDDGIVNVLDLLSVIGAWGPCPDPNPDICSQQGLGDCYAAHGSPGCNEPTCCSALCTFDPYCCEVEWDGLCAGVANLTADCENAVHPNCGNAKSGDCFEAVDSAPGCSDPACCGNVCAIDPYCCNFGWDATCANLAADMCN